MTRSLPARALTMYLVEPVSSLIYMISLPDVALLLATVRLKVSTAPSELNRVGTLVAVIC
jgi:hypothetical protein